MKREERAKMVVQGLEELYPEAFCKLQYQGVPERLVIATILSAQTTDEAVNKATPGLWERYPDMESLAEAELEDVQELLKTIGLFRNKSKSIVGAAAWIRDNGLPETIEELVKIPGVGRKTANVIIGEVFHKPSITVDTHVKRLSGRLGLSGSDNPDRIEMDLKGLIPQEEQTMFSHRLITHGRQVCRARNPRCGICPFAGFCLYTKKKEGAV
ncbi:MAG TPA: endonuclease III [Candidatus Sabulitectum sp.]|nr:endonuclease III [Candidatus Sabulitectum sp.]